MPWEPLDHTADAGVVVTAAGREELFRESLRALTDCLTELDSVRASDRLAVRVSAPDLEQLLVEWLGEALYRFDAEGFLAADARLTITDSATGGLELDGELRGESHDGRRHPLKLLVKAVTYHGLEIGRPAGGGWRARVIFDI